MFLSKMSNEQQQRYIVNRPTNCYETDGNIKVVSVDSFK